MQTYAQDLASLHTLLLQACDKDDFSIGSHIFRGEVVAHNVRLWRKLSIQVL